MTISTTQRCWCPARSTRTVSSTVRTTSSSGRSPRRRTSRQKASQPGRKPADYRPTKGRHRVSQVIVFLLLGIGSGGLIAGIGMGVVLSYRGAGVINLAAGAVAMLAGFFFWSIRLGKFATIPTVPAVILTLLFAAVVGVMFDQLLVRPLRTATLLAKLIAALGALLALQAAAVLIFGPGPRQQPTVLPTGNVLIGGAPVPV